MASVRAAKKCKEPQGKFSEELEKWQINSSQRLFSLGMQLGYACLSFTTTFKNVLPNLSSDN